MLKSYQDIRKSENNKVKGSLVDGDVDVTDIMTMVFDIFSKRKNFDYNTTERLMLYLGFLGPVLRFLRCRSLNYDHMIKVKKKF